jgi:separase
MEKVALVEQLFIDAGSAMFLHHHISNADTSFTNNHASITAYYFEMAKCIGIRREMQIYLDQRLLSAPTTAKNDLIWPKAICGLTDPSAPNEDSRSQPSLLPQPTAAHLFNLRQLYQQEYNLDGAEFQRTFIDILPPHWTVCSLSLNVDDQVLYATRYRANEPPFVLRLPLGRTSKRHHPKHSKHISNGISYQEAVKEFKSIMDLNDETMHSSNITMLQKDVEGWWMTRSQLDIRLKLLLEDMERSWIGGFQVSLRE